jgi:hypothetical protein
MTTVLFLMAITLNIFTGEEINRTEMSGPYKTLDECERAQFQTGFQKPDGAGRIVVPMCVALTGGQHT